MKKLLNFFAIVVASLVLSSYTVDEVPNVHVKDRNCYVTNPDGLLSAEAEAQLNVVLGDIWQQTSAEPVVVIISTIGDEDYNDFATALFTKWGIGKKDKSNGVLILIVDDIHKAVIRTGYGSEGLLPDIICGRIIRDKMAPHFRDADYDGGTLEAVNFIHEILTTPGAVEELKSQYENDAAQQETDPEELFTAYVALSLFFGFIGFVFILIMRLVYRKKDYFARYQSMKKFRTPLLIITFLTMGMALPAWLLVLWSMRRYRNHKRRCPNCGKKMRKLNEQEDNKYLNAAQNVEEQLNSVDYDVWLCPQCGEVDILPYVNNKSLYKECPQCHARALQLVSNRVIKQATTRATGKGVKTYACKGCGHRYEQPYTIPRRDDDDIAGGLVAGAAISGAFGGGGGGGFSGGSFGGGSTGGGGASGGW
ncbi:MAG: TPM domain-containing protein [Candidatus Limisoma sp.]